LDNSETAKEYASPGYLVLPDLTKSNNTFLTSLRWDQNLSYANTLNGLIGFDGVHIDINDYFVYIRYEEIKRKMKW